MDRGGRQRLGRRVVAEYVFGFELGRLGDRYGRRVGHGGYRGRWHHQCGHGQHGSGSVAGGGRVNGGNFRLRTTTRARVQYHYRTRPKVRVNGFYDERFFFFLKKNSRNFR